MQAWRLVRLRNDTDELKQFCMGMSGEWCGLESLAGGCGATGDE